MFNFEMFEILLSGFGILIGLIMVSLLLYTIVSRYKEKFQILGGAAPSDRKLVRCLDNCEHQDLYGKIKCRELCNKMTEKNSPLYNYVPPLTPTEYSIVEIEKTLGHEPLEKDILKQGLHYHNSICNRECARMCGSDAKTELNHKCIEKCIVKCRKEELV